MSFRDYLSLYKYTWIFCALFFVLSATSMALDNIIPQFFAFMFIFSTALSFLSIFVVNWIIIIKFKNNKRYINFFRNISPDNNYSANRHEVASNKDIYADPINDPSYSSMPGNVYYSGD